MNTISKKIDVALKKNLKNEFIMLVEEIKQIIVDEYDDKLMSIKSDKSKIDYNKYRDEFITRLNEFQFIKDNRNGIILDIPDMETFDFSGGLEIIQTIMEGLSGIYVEVDQQEYLYVFGRKPRFTEAVDNRVASKDRVFLIRYTGNVRRIEKELNKLFVRYPFSNSSPIDVLEAGNLFVEKNIDQWIDDIIQKSNKEVVVTYK